jgi:hypothetical protein
LIKDCGLEKYHLCRSVAQNCFEISNDSAIDTAFSIDIVPSDHSGV